MGHKTKKKKPTTEQRNKIRLSLNNSRYDARYFDSKANSLKLKKRNNKNIMTETGFTKISGVAFEKVRNGKRFIKFDLDFINNKKLFKKWEKLIKKENIIGCFVNVSIRIHENDMHKFDVKRLSHLLQKAFYVKPMTKKIVFTGPYPDMSTNQDEINFFMLNPLEAVNHMIALRKPSNTKRIKKIAKRIIKDYDIDFDGLKKNDFGWSRALVDGHEIKVKKKIKKVRKVKK